MCWRCSRRHDLREKHGIEIRTIFPQLRGMTEGDKEDLLSRALLGPNGHALWEAWKIQHGRDKP